MKNERGKPSRGLRRSKGSARRSASAKYVLHLYVAGLSPRSQKALENIKRICVEHLPGRYKLLVHDIYQNPLSAKSGQILAAPTLIKEMPLPLRKFVGDMSDTMKLIVGLDLRPSD